MANIQDHIRKTSAQNQSGGKAGNDTLQKSHRKFTLRWDFWNNHAIAFWCSLVGGLLLTPLLDAPDMKPRHVWAVGIGLWILVGGAISFVCHSVVHHMTDTSEQEAEERLRSDREHKIKVESRLDSLSNRLIQAEEVIESQRPRRLTDDQKRFIGQAVSNYRHVHFVVQTPMFTPEAMAYGQDFVDAIARGGCTCMFQSTSSFLPNFNTLVCLSEIYDQKKPKEEREIIPNSLHNAAGVLSGILGSLQLTQDGTKIALIPEVSKDQVFLRIGVKMPQTQTSKFVSTG